MTLFIGLTLAAAIAGLAFVSWALVHYGTGVVKIQDVMAADPKEDGWVKDLEAKQKEEAEG